MSVPARNRTHKHTQGLRNKVYFVELILFFFRNAASIRLRHKIGDSHSVQFFGIF
jgi:hypothetical protein